MTPDAATSAPAITPDAATFTPEATSSRPVSPAGPVDLSDFPGWSVAITEEVPDDLSVYHLLLALLPDAEIECVESTLAGETPATQLMVADFLAASGDFMIFDEWMADLRETGCLGAGSQDHIDLGMDWWVFVAQLPEAEADCLDTPNYENYFGLGYWFEQNPSAWECVGDQSLARFVMGSLVDRVVGWELGSEAQECMGELLADDVLVGEMADRIRPVIAAEPDDFPDFLGADISNREQILMFFASVPFIQCLSPETLAELDFEDIDQLACALEETGSETLADYFNDPDSHAEVETVVDRCYATPTSRSFEPADAPVVSGICGA